MGGTEGIVFALVALGEAGESPALAQGANAVARGVVENLADGVATARVLTAASPSLTLARSTKAHFASPDAFARHPLTASLTF